MILVSYPEHRPENKMLMRSFNTKNGFEAYTSDKSEALRFASGRSCPKGERSKETVQVNGAKITYINELIDEADY